MRTRPGMTLTEVLVAITMLAGAALAVASIAAKLTRADATSEIRDTATDIAAQRIEEVRYAPSGGEVDSLYTGVVMLGGRYHGFTRRTLVARPAGALGQGDLRTVTVWVSHPRLARPVERTTVIAGH